MLLPKVKVATGMYANWDSFMEVTPQALDWIRSHRKTAPKSTILESLEEAAYTLNEALNKGGREFIISKKLYDALNAIFSRRQRRLGGNGYHMGNALHQLGLTPLVSFPSRAESIMSAAPEFKIACGDGFRTSCRAIRLNDPEYDHLIFEFHEDLALSVHVESRHILSWDLMSFHGHFDEDFLYYASNPEYTDIMIIAYAHLLLPDFRHRTDRVIASLDDGRRPRVHLEFGQGSEASMEYAAISFSDSQCVDSWGLNEKECVQYFGAASEKLEDLKEAAHDAIRRYGLRRICIHTPRFAFSISKGDAERETNALHAGCLATAALTLGDIRSTASAAELPMSDVEAKTEKTGEGYVYCQMPTYINRQPKTLTGLGDSFSAVCTTLALA